MSRPVEALFLHFGIFDYRNEAPEFRIFIDGMSQEHLYLVVRGNSLNPLRPGEYFMIHNVSDEDLAHIRSSRRNKPYVLIVNSCDISYSSRESCIFDIKSGSYYKLECNWDEERSNKEDPMMMRQFYDSVFWMRLDMWEPSWALNRFCISEPPYCPALNGEIRRLTRELVREQAETKRKEAEWLALKEKLVLRVSVLEAENRVEMDDDAIRAAAERPEDISSETKEQLIRRVYKLEAEHKCRDYDDKIRAMTRDLRPTWLDEPEQLRHRAELLEVERKLKNEQDEMSRREQILLESQTELNRKIDYLEEERMNLNETLYDKKEDYNALAYRYVKAQMELEEMRKEMKLMKSKADVVEEPQSSNWHRTLFGTEKKEVNKVELMLPSILKMPVPEAHVASKKRYPMKEQLYGICVGLESIDDAGIYLKMWLLEKHCVATMFLENDGRTIPSGHLGLLCAATYRWNEDTQQFVDGIFMERIIYKNLLVRKIKSEEEEREVEKMEVTVRLQMDEMKKNSNGAVYFQHKDLGTLEDDYGFLKLVQEDVIDAICSFKNGAWFIDGVTKVKA